LSRSLPAAAHRAARPLALGSGFDDDHPCPLVAASIRWSISSPAPRSFHPSACKHRHGITDWSSIAPSSTAAAASPQSSAAFTSCRSCQNHPSPKLLPRQIPIDRQTIIAFPRVPSSEAFRRRPPILDRSLAPGPHPKPFTTAVTYPNGGEPSLATHFGRSPSAEEEYEWRIVPILRGPGATCLSPD